jgi:hypothetical protein
MTWTDPNSFRIDISFTAYRKMMAAIATTGKEVSGFGTVKVYERYQEIPWKTLRRIPKQGNYGIAFRVEDVWLLDHGSYAETEIDDAKAAQFYSQRMNEGYRPENFKLWWHRHPLAQGWSATDEHCIRNTPMGNSIAPKATGWLISLVWCTRTGWNGRFDQIADPGFTIHVPVTIDNEVAFESDIQHELDHLTHQTANLSNYWYTSANAQMFREPVAQLDLFDNNPPWWEFVDSEATEVAEAIRDSLFEIEWSRADEDVALPFIEDAADKIVRRAKRQGGVDQADIEDIVLNTAREYDIQHDSRELLEMVRWS